MVEVSVFVFDLGNVLIPWDRRRLYAQLIADPAELDFFLENVLTMEENAKLDAGTTLPEVAADLKARFPEYGELLDAFETRWSETVGEPITESVDILARLVGDGFRCIALSNWGWDTFESVQKRFDFLDLFEARVISGYEGVVKPDPAIFRLMCERHNFEPSAAFFIDDSVRNIAAADELGFHTHLFTEPGLLYSDLVARGLLDS